MSVPTGACESACDCGAPGGYPHEPDCNSFNLCDEGDWCDKHLEEALRAYLANVALGAVTGKLSDEDIQALRDAGRGHLLGGER